MSKVSKRTQEAMYALADQRAGTAGMVQCEGCEPGVLVPEGGEYEGLCSYHWYQTQFHYGIPGGVSHC